VTAHALAWGTSVTHWLPIAVVTGACSRKRARGRSAALVLNPYYGHMGGLYGSE
jgi:hypothetical protein